MSAVPCRQADVGLYCVLICQPHGSDPQQPTSRRLVMVCDHTLRVYPPHNSKGTTVTALLPRPLSPALGFPHPHPRPFGPAESASPVTTCMCAPPSTFQSSWWVARTARKP